MRMERDDELSLHMRIPADTCYLANAMLTLDGICEHYSLSEHAKDRVKKALSTALSASIEINYRTGRGLFELSFAVLKDKLRITVEDMKINEEEGQDEESLSAEDKLREMLSSVTSLTDSLLFREKTGRCSCFSMEFAL